MIVQLLDGSEETLAAVAGMFHCKAKGTFYPVVCTTFSNHPASFICSVNDQEKFELWISLFSMPYPLMSLLMCRYRVDIRI